MARFHEPLCDPLRNVDSYSVAHQLPSMARARDGVGWKSPIRAKSLQSLGVTNVRLHDLA
jgi:hypothetical protein